MAGRDFFRIPEIKARCDEVFLLTSTFDLINLISISVMYSSRHISVWKTMFTFLTTDPWGLEPCESKVNMGHVHTKTNQHLQYNSSVINSSKKNHSKNVFTKHSFVTLAFDLVNKQSIQVVFSPRPISMWTMNVLW